jgi:hypothetical protein
MNPLLLTTILTMAGTYYGTHQKTEDSYQDKIFQLRERAKQEEGKEIHGEVMAGKLFPRRGLTGQSYYLNKKKVSRERYVRHLLETFFRYKFPSVRPVWLKNPKTGRNMELDCYCKEMNLCVEIDGVQHHKYLPYFHKGGYQEFLEMKERDQMKNVLIKQRGLHLVRLPHTVADQDIEAYLLAEINKKIK